MTQDKTHWEKAIIDELVTYSGQTFSNASEAHTWLNEAFYRIAEKAREEGRQEALKETFAKIWPERGILDTSIRQEERSRILAIVEEMKKVYEMNTDYAAHKAIDVWNQALESLKEKIGEKNGNS